MRVCLGLVQQGVEVGRVEEVLVLQGAQALRQQLLPVLHRLEGGGEGLVLCPAAAHTHTHTHTHTLRNAALG